MLHLPKLNHQYVFPPTSNALTEPNGLLAFGGDLSVGRLKLAYQQGIFPWFNQDEPILWWSPSPRAVIELDQFHCSKSLKKLINKRIYSLTLNYAFDRVIEACASVKRIPSGDFSNIETPTWICPTMISAYQQLHRAGLASSIEVWREDELVGGLYGVTLGAIFCGESMFHKVSNASKLAFWGLVQHMRKHQLAFIDCQIENPHLTSLGCKTIPRSAFLDKLTHAQTLEIDLAIWQSQRINY